MSIKSLELSSKDEVEDEENDRKRIPTDLYMRSAVSLREMQKKTRQSGPKLKYMDFNTGLHRALGESQIQNIKKVFYKTEDKRLNAEQLKHALLEYGNVYYPDDELYNLIFQQINIGQDGYATWDEFISHLIMLFKIQDVTAEIKSLEDPINRKPRIVKSYHRHPINKIVFNFQVKPDRSFSYTDGSYITLSHDGTLNYWSLDLYLERSVQSKSPDLKIADTWVLGVVAMPDVSVVCTASTERDLRFYDTSARKFELRVQFYSLEFAACSMYYTFPKELTDDCRLIIGDMGGNVKVIHFSPINRGPFRSKMGVPLLAVPFDRVEKGLVPGFKVTCFRNLHRDWVRQVEFYSTMNMIVSCSTSPRGVVVHDMDRGFYGYMIPKGTWCFACADAFPELATGGPDCTIRVWNPFVTKRPSVTFHGHHTGIIALVFQDRGTILASLSEDKCVKIWEVPAQVCMQTYLGLGSELGEYTRLTMFYNPCSRQLIIGGVQIASIFLRPLPNGEHTDGFSHCASVSVLLFNALFGIIVSCGLDSNIIVWDPWTGRRLSVVKDAHIRTLHGEVIPVDITAGCFDPGSQYLLTGAFDGSLKTWDHRTGSCLRNMRIEHGCEVTGVTWLKGRILAIGWNRHVTEFSDSGGAAGPGGAFCKMWSIKHTDDVLATATRIPQTLATSTYNGELVLWRLETGQPYKQFSVADPTMRIKITYDFEKRTRHEKPKVTPLSRKYGLYKDLKKPPPPPPPNPSAIIRKLKAQERKELIASTKPGREAVARLQLSRPAKPLELPATICPIRGLAVRCMIFLHYRPMKIDVGTLLVALESGDVQIWSHHLSGGFLSAFQAVHSVGDYVVSMASDEQNEYLFAGSTEGYIKTFLLVNFHSGNPPIHICMPYYRSIFPFLWYRFFPGRAMRALGGQTNPLLVNSYKAHRQIVSGLVYVNKPKVLVSSSADFSVRLWTLGGRYLGTLGTFKTWVAIDPHVPIDVTSREFTIPPDVARVMSSTSLRVFLGEKWEKKLTKKQEAALLEKDNIFAEVNVQTYGRKLTHPILGQYVTIPQKKTHKFEVTLDTTFPYIPVYQHIIRPLPVELPKLREHSTMLNNRKEMAMNNINNMRPSGLFLS